MPQVFIFCFHSQSECHSQTPGYFSTMNIRVIKNHVRKFPRSSLPDPSKVSNCFAFNLKTKHGNSSQPFLRIYGAVSSQLDSQLSLITKALHCLTIHLAPLASPPSPLWKSKNCFSRFSAPLYRLLLATFPLSLWCRSKSGLIVILVVTSA